MRIHHYSSTAFNFNGFQVGDDSNIQEEIELFQGKHSISGMELLGENEIDPLTSANNGKGTNLFKDQNQQPPPPPPQQQQQQQEQLKVDDMILEDVNFDSDLFKDQNQQPQPPSSLAIASLELLRNYGAKFKKISGENISDNFSNNIETGLLDHQKLSTEEIIRVAGARYVHYSAHWNDNFCIPMHPYGLDLGSLSEEENRDVELAQFLLAAAERVGCQQYERAGRLLLHCQWNSDVNANAAQRVIYHFAEALRERINKETGRIASPSSSSCYGPQRNEERELHQKLDTKMSLKCHQNIPFNQVMQFTGIQAIVENVASETKIHMIDLDIKSGVQCIALMQALADRKDLAVKFFKVSAIGTVEFKDKIEETGQRLTSFAESLNFPFSYKAIIVTDMAEIKLDHFEVDEDDAVVVYSPYFLRNLISRPECLEKFMLVIRNIKPSIMIVLEVDANHNTPSFVNRFIEALFFYSAFFDCVETCMEQDTEARIATEAILSVGIRNIVGAEGRERTVRNVKIDVWRRFFARYKMVETGFSESSLYQANLVAKEFYFGKFCTIHNNGKSLIVGWKGTPMHSLSAWRFA